MPASAWTSARNARCAALPDLFILGGEGARRNTGRINTRLNWGSLATYAPAGKGEGWKKLKGRAAGIFEGLCFDCRGMKIDARARECRGIYCFIHGVGNWGIFRGDGTMFFFCFWSGVDWLLCLRNRSRVFTNRLGKFETPGELSLSGGCKYLKNKYIAVKGWVLFWDALSIVFQMTWKC